MAGTEQRTKEYWDCDCFEGYYKPVSQLTCPKCRANQIDCLGSIVATLPKEIRIKLDWSKVY